MGFCWGVQPLLAYNYAALKYDKMKQIFKKSVIISLAMSLLSLIPLLVFTKSIIKLFIDNQNVIEQGTYFLRILSIPIPLIGLFFLIMTTFRAIGKAWPSFVLSICRQGVAFIPALLIGNHFFKLDGVIFSRPISDAFAFFISLFIFYKLDIFHKFNKTKI